MGSTLMNDNNNYFFGSGYTLVSRVTLTIKGDPKPKMYGVTILDDGVTREQGSISLDHAGEPIEGATILWFPTRKQRDRVISSILGISVKKHLDEVENIQIRKLEENSSEKE